MSRVLLSIVFIMFTVLPVYSYQEDILQNIFITDVPDAPEAPKTEDEIEALRGYAEYVEGEEDLYLTDKDGQFVLNLKQPQKISSESLIDKNKPKFNEKSQVVYSKFSSDEYRISDFGKKNSEQIGNLSFGTIYNSSISTTQLERETGLFTRYEIKNFALNSSYQKTLGTAGGVYYDNIYLTPEYKLNNFFTVKNVFSYDPVRNRKKSKLVLLINPFGNTEKDRLKLEVGAGQTYDVNNYLIRQQVEFSTNFKL